MMTKCQICEKEYKNYIALASHIYQNHKITSKEYYDTYLKKVNEGICLMYEKVESCKKYTKFSGLRIGYLTYCSSKCVMADPKIQEERKINYFNKTGFENPAQNPEIQQKKEDVYFQKTGYKISFQNPEILEKKSQSYYEKTGYRNPGQNPEVQQKMRKTYYEKTGYLYPGQNPEVQQKMRKTYYEKTGYLHPSQNPEVRELAKYTYFKKTGYNYPLENPEIHKKSRKTYYEKTGYLHSSQNPEVMRNILGTCRENFLHVFKKVLEDNNLELLDFEYMHEKFEHTWRCTKCNYIFKTCWNNIQQKYKCPKCYPRNCGQSQGEIELGNWIKSLGLDIIQKDKNIIGKELDIYISSLKIAIEYDGTYWHSENAQKNYYPDSNEDSKSKQLIKTELCTEKDIQLIHIFDDEWILYQNQVKDLLQKILLEKYDLLPNDCDMITLDRRFSKNPKYYQKLGYEVKIIESKLYPNNGNFTVWNVGYLKLRRIKV